MKHAHENHEPAVDASTSTESEAPARDSFRIRGMDCADEIAVLRREIGPIVGGEQHLGFDLLHGRMVVRRGAAAVPASSIIAAVKATGMKAEAWTVGPKRAPEGFLGKYGRNLAVIGSGVGTSAGFAIHAFLAGGPLAALGSDGVGVVAGPPIAARVAYGVAILAGLWLVAPKAWFALRRLRPDMNLLMLIAVAGALAIGDWLEAATVTFLFAVSLTLESWSVGRARRAVEALMSLAAPSARVQRDGRELDVPPDQVRVGESIVVRPGERVPLDGQVASGESQVNQAPITGESAPVAKSSGSDVFAGTINGEGALVIRTTKEAGDTTLAHIIGMVAEAQSQRGPSEQWVEKFAAYYTPLVLASATLLVVVPTLAGGDFQTWLYRALVLLVIGCPCSLVISTPVTIVSGIASAARHGVLVKGGVHLEVAAKLRALAIDKTGTLTEGRPRVVEIIPLAEHDEKQLLELALALEAHSEHPIARAIAAHAEAKGIASAPAESFQILPGKGATARIGGEAYWIGSHRFLEERGQETPDVHARLEAMASAGRTAVVIGNEKHVCGLVALADAIRPASVAALKDLRSVGVTRIVMLTGDNRGSAQAVATETGVDEVHAELLPADKVAAIEKLVAEHEIVAMVGDGVNDAPALARATLGIAMGVAGSDAALETADVALMSDDLGKLAWLVRHSRRTGRIVRQNIVFSLAVKAVFVVLALCGVSSLWMAIAADMGASLIVTFNGLRMLR